MAVAEFANLDTLVNLIRAVKPSLADSPIHLDDSLVDTLGLDSLDIMQLARKARRTFGPGFDAQAWAANNAAHRYLVRSLLDAAGEAPVAGGNLAAAQVAIAPQ